jgi:hypothetical protein
MGFHVRSLQHLPLDPFDYYIHVVTKYRSDAAAWLKSDVASLSELVGLKAAIVTGPPQLTWELSKFLSSSLGERASAVHFLFEGTATLVISDGHLAHTSKPVYILPLAVESHEWPSKTPINDEREFITVVIAMLGRSLKSGNLTQVLQNLGAVPIEVTQSRVRVLLCTLREVNSMLELKPNVAGIGVNITAAIDKWLTWALRPRE